MREFIAVDIPVNFKEKVYEHYPDTHWIRRAPADKLHITLFFFENIDERVSGLVEQSMKTISHPSFTLSIGGLNTFSMRDPRVVFNDILSGSEHIMQIHDDLLKLMSETDVPIEKREFHPHLTFGRVPHMNSDVRAHVISYVNENNKRIPNISFECSSMSLIESRPRNSGMVYTVLYKKPFEDL